MKIMTLYINCFEFITVESDEKKVCQILFDGKAKGDYFYGRILPGGVDTQKINSDGSGTLSARYMLEGYDLTGQFCRIFVENNAKLKSSDTVPTIVTDSKSLKWLEKASLYGKLDTSDGKVEIDIFANIPDYEYEFGGHVESGNQIGRKMGIPTVNIPVEEGENFPQFGVYVATVMAEGIGLLKGIANIGRKPTVERFDENGKLLPNPVGVEVFIFDFDGDLYNRNIKVYFHEFVREEKKFDSFDSLKKQIDEDIIKTKTILEKIYETA